MRKLSTKKNLDLLHLKSRFRIFFGIPQTNYLALSKDEKSRMFKDYYKKLVLKYFDGKNIFLSFFLYCLRLFLEIFTLSGVWCSDLFFSSYFL